MILSRRRHTPPPQPPRGACPIAPQLVRDHLAREIPAALALHLVEQPRALSAVVQSWATAMGATPGESADLTADIVGCGPLHRLLADERVTEIMVNGPSSVHVEVDGRLHPSDVRFRDAHHLRAVIDRLVAAAGCRLDHATPTVDAMLPDGSRLNAVLPPVAVGGPMLTIRRPPRGLHLPDLVRSRTLPRAVAAFLHATIVGRCNVVVSGGTGAGKTTLLAALAALIPPDQRIVTIEDVAELRIEHPHVASQQCRLDPAVGAAVVDMRALVRNTLRMRPDRIVVGEVRGGEAADMIAAMNTGHPGSMGTVHANSATDALARLETMVAGACPTLGIAAVRSRILAAIDIVVHCERDATGIRRVEEVTALDDSGPTPVFRLGASDSSALLRRPPDRCLDRLARHGVDFAPELLVRRHVA